MVGILGTVTDEDGEPVEGASVYLMSSAGVAMASVQSAFDGTYTFDGVAPGSYRLMVTREGFAATFNGGVGSLEQASDVLVGDGVVVVDVVLRSSTSTGVDDPGELPGTLVLGGNYPNPFNPTTTVLVDLPESADVGLEVFDLLGRRVLRVSAGWLAAGEGRTVAVDAGALASGVYLYRLRAEGASHVWSATGRMTLVK